MRYGTLLVEFAAGFIGADIVYLSLGQHGMSFTQIGIYLQGD
jgi:hypothetical protein